MNAEIWNGELDARKGKEIVGSWRRLLNRIYLPFMFNLIFIPCLVTIDKEVFKVKIEIRAKALNGNVFHPHMNSDSRHDGMHFLSPIAMLCHCPRRWEWKSEGSVCVVRRKSLLYLSL